jgi:hypothetical protein
MCLVRALCRNQRWSSCEVVRVCNHFPYNNRPLHIHKHNDPFKVRVIYLLRRSLMSMQSPAAVMRCTSAVESDRYNSARSHKSGEHELW